MYLTLAQQRALISHFGKKRHPCASRNPPSWCTRKKRKSTRKSSAAQKRTRKQAAQAMRIHQREGVSLKTAWRRVKTGKGKGTTRARKNSLASRAMKMAHRDGISLKTAWRRVKGTTRASARSGKRRKTKFG